MLEPSTKTLANAEKRAVHALARRRALPRDLNESGPAKQVAVQPLESQNRASEKMTHYVSQLRGTMYFPVRRAGVDRQAIKRDYMTRQAREPANKIGQIDNDGFADIPSRWRAREGRGRPGVLGPMGLDHQ